MYEPSVRFPNFGRPRVVGRMMDRRRLLPTRKFLDDCGCKKIIIYLWRPGFAGTLDIIDHDMSCYHIDDEYTFSPVEKQLEAREAALISRVNQIFIHSPALMGEKGHINPNTSVVPNGVDYDAFSTPVSEPADMCGIPNPRVGYVGKIKTRLDINLLVTLADAIGTGHLSLLVRRSL